MSQPSTKKPILPLPASPSRGAAIGARSAAFNNLLAEALAPVAPLSPSAKEMEVEAWMAPGGRLRIGSDGVPIKFNLHKVATAKNVVAAAAAVTGGPATAGKTSAVMTSTASQVSGTTSTTTKMTSSFVAAAATTSIDVGSTASSLTQRVSQDVESAGSSSNHSLQLLYALIGDDISKIDLG